MRRLVSATIPVRNCSSMLKLVGKERPKSAPLRQRKPANTPASAARAPKPVLNIWYQPSSQSTPSRRAGSSATAVTLTTRHANTTSSTWPSHNRLTNPVMRRVASRDTVKSSTSIGRDKAAAPAPNQWPTAMDQG